jgi:Flp pilus assembly protein TadD
MNADSPMRVAGRQSGLLRAGAIILALLVSACADTTPATGGAASGTLPPGDPAGVLNVADAAIAGNDPGMALKVSQSVLASDPKNLDALFHEGAAYYAMGRCQDAIAAFKVALTIDPKSSPAETGIGRCLLKQNAAEAELTFRAAVRDDPSNAAALNDLGISLDLQGKYAAATQPYQQALLLQPGTTATEVNLGMSEALSGDSTDALQYLGPLATGQDATPKIREDYATALVAAGRMDEARQILSIDLAPDQVTALLSDLSGAIENTGGQAATTAVSAPAAPVAATAAVTPVVATPVAATPPAPMPAAAAPPAVQAATASPAPAVAPQPAISADPPPSARPSPPPAAAAPAAAAAPIMPTPIMPDSAATDNVVR